MRADAWTSTAASDEARVARSSRCSPCPVPLADPLAKVPGVGALDAGGMRGTGGVNGRTGDRSVMGSRADHIAPERHSGSNCADPPAPVLRDAVRAAL
jgi:hypothetical protein